MARGSLLASSHHPRQTRTTPCPITTSQADVTWCNIGWPYVALHFGYAFVYLEWRILWNNFDSSRRLIHWAKALVRSDRLWLGFARSQVFLSILKIFHSSKLIAFPEFIFPPLAPGEVYRGPDTDTSCQCNTVFYSLLSACGACQGHDFIGSANSI